jgi:predicted NBD/HSP70 family sugar kinase
LSSQKFVFAPNLNWHAADLKDQLEKATGLSASMENAANACALSEFWFGKHADGINNLVVVTVSEGIGVGMILNGQLVRGNSGLAGEFGHVALTENGPKCGCGNHGCWEVYASNSAAVRYYNEAKSTRGEPKSVQTFGQILQLNANGNARAARALEQMAEFLGKGLAMVVAGLAPDVIVIVGDISQVWSKVGPIVTDVVRQRATTHASVKLTATSTASPRLRGIVALVLQRYFGVPAVA